MFSFQLNAFVVQLLASLEAQRILFGERRSTQPSSGRKPNDHELPRHSISILAMACALELVEWAVVDDIGDILTVASR